MKEEREKYFLNVTVLPNISHSPFISVGTERFAVLMQNFKHSLSNGMNITNFFILLYFQVITSKRMENIVHTLLKLK
jgi:hypothetical protein